MPKTFSAKALILSIFRCSAPQTIGKIISKYDKTLRSQAAGLRNNDNPKMTVRIKGAEHRNISQKASQS